MKAIIKVCTASKEFNNDQKQILRRVAMVLIGHNLSVDIQMKIKTTKHLKLNVL